MTSRPYAIAALLSLLFVAATRAEDAYYSIPLQKLTITEGSLPAGANNDWRPWNRWQSMQAYAVLDGDGECYVWAGQTQEPGTPRPAASGNLVIGAQAAGEVAGSLYVPNQDSTGMQRVRFKASTADFTTDRPQFLRAKLAHYRDLQNRQIPGGAWFRHQARTIARELGEKVDDNDRNQQFNWRGRQNDDFSETFALFSGGRAVSESLQLDRVLPPATQPAEQTVKLDTIAGITVQEMDWAALTKDLKPELDPLASIIPADQHAIFFPTFDAAIALIDEAQKKGSLMLVSAESRSEDAFTQQRYERQLCLPLGGLARLLGPHMIDSVAVTGSDPYLRVGSDIAILFEAKDPESLSKLIAAQVALARQASGATAISGQVKGITYTAAVSLDRAISSYSATLENTVVVTNSLAQLQRIVATHKAESPALASLLEYVFFRDRYKRGEEGETALLILSDATIRRWCGPRWRIADSRRTRAAAVLSDLQAQQARDIVANAAASATLTPERAVPQMGEVKLTPAGVVSATYGSLGFLTPISELDIGEVTKTEADSYARWRNSYQENWRWFFDPIACRFSLKGNKTGVDLTVMPLIAATEYKQFIEITGGGSLKPTSGDPHDAIAHLAVAINPESGTLRGYGHMLQNIIGNLRIEPLAWLGSSAAVYADDDPFWAELAAAKETDKFFEKNFHRLPVALYVESQNGLRLAAFLTAARAFVEQAAPGLTKWDTLKHGEQTYAKITSDQLGARGQTIAIYYAAMPKALIVTLNEEVLKRAIDRQLSPSTMPGTQPIEPWLGQNLSLRVEHKMLEVIEAIAREQALAAAQAQAWSNIPILNEWKRQFPDKDPIEVQQRLFASRPIDPAGGKYIWNGSWQTMESTTYGHPGEPKAGPALTAMLGRLNGNFGLTFDNKGLRARAEVEESRGE